MSDPRTLVQNRTAPLGPNPQRLVSSAPLLALIERWGSDLDVLQRCGPTSDVTMLQTRCLAELVAALRDARDVQTELTLREAQVLSGIPESTLRWLAKHRARAVGAKPKGARREDEGKGRNRHYFDRVQFERWRQNPRVVEAEAARAEAEEAAHVAGVQVAA